MRDRFAPGGLLHYGQGKWYPGEPLPRWSFSLFWRCDGVPIWREPGLIAREAATQTPVRDDAQRFTERVAERLGIMADYVQPVFEDPADRLLKQGALPVNVDLTDPKIDDPLERDRILRLFDSELTQPAGFVLPVQRWTAQANPGWLSELWRTRRERLYLVPGDSPAGLAAAAELACPILPRSTIRIRCRPIHSPSADRCPTRAHPTLPPTAVGDASPRGRGGFSGRAIPAAVRVRFGAHRNAGAHRDDGRDS